MNHLATVTAQAICSYAITSNINLASAPSCICLSNVAAVLKAGREVESNLLEAYHKHSNANINTSGFFHISLKDWWLMPLHAKQDYRTEMLYYFWMANQDSMDAFS